MKYLGPVPGDQNEPLRHEFEIAQGMTVEVDHDDVENAMQRTFAEKVGSVQIGGHEFSKEILDEAIRETESAHNGAEVARQYVKNKGLER